MLQPQNGTFSKKSVQKLNKNLRFMTCFHSFALKIENSRTAGVVLPILETKNINNACMLRICMYLIV